MTQKKHLFDRKTFPPFAKAVAEFVHNCNLYAKGEASTLPPNHVTLKGVAKPLPACSVYQTATQPILKNVPTKILFNTVEFDTTGAFNVANSRFQPKVAGYYQISCGCGVNAGSVKNYTSLFKNGVEYRRSTTSSDGGNTRLSTLVSLNGTTDYVEGFVTVSQNFSTVTGVILTSFSAVFVQPAVAKAVW